MKSTLISGWAKSCYVISGSPNMLGYLHRDSVTAPPTFHYYNSTLVWSSTNTAPPPPTHTHSLFLSWLLSLLKIFSSSTNHSATGPQSEPLAYLLSLRSTLQGASDPSMDSSYTTSRLIGRWNTSPRSLTPLP